MNELSLIQKIKQGDTEAFGKLYDEYLKKIYNFIYYKTYHQETAEDLTSLTFTKALEKIANFDSQKASFSTWLYSIARYTVIDFYRQERPNMSLDDVWDLTDKEDLEIDLENKFNLQEIGKYLKTLEAEKREIIFLRVWEGLSYKEIAEIIGKSENNCKMIFSRTISKLRIEMPLALFILLLINKL
jgi:RNA polymerase sigma-70 factor, ECF subfamily